MKVSSKWLLGSLAAVMMAACGPPKNDTTTGGTGSETGAVGGAPTTGADTGVTGTAGGAMSDSAAILDSAKVEKDSIVR